MKKVGIIAVGKYVPKKVLTNADLEKMVETSDEWITTRTGIKERRIVAKGEAASDLAAKAAKDALAEAKLDPQNLELIIVASITPDMQFPATACILQNALGAKKAVAFDVSAACSGFVYALTIAEQFIARGVYKNALVVGAEVLTSITDWKDRNTCVLFGDGAGAAVLSEVKSGGIISTYLGADGAMGELLYLPGGGSRMPASAKTVESRMHYLKMHGNELFKIAINTMSSAAETVLKQAGLKAQDIHLVIPHQANTRIIAMVAKKLKLPMDKFYLNIERYGNMSSASLAVALCEAVKEGRVKKGDYILLDAFGAGLVWGAMIIKW